MEKKSCLTNTKDTQTIKNRNHVRIRNPTPRKTHSLVNGRAIRPRPRGNNSFAQERSYSVIPGSTFICPQKRYRYPSPEKLEQFQKSNNIQSNLKKNWRPPTPGPWKRKNSESDCESQSSSALSSYQIPPLKPSLKKSKIDAKPDPKTILFWNSRESELSCEEVRAMFCWKASARSGGRFGNFGEPTSRTQSYIREKLFSSYVDKHLDKDLQVGPEMRNICGRICDPIKSRIVWWVEWKDPKLAQKNLVLDEFMKSYDDYLFMLEDYMSNLCAVPWLPQSSGLTDVTLDVKGFDLNEIMYLFKDCFDYHPVQLTTFPQSDVDDDPRSPEIPRKRLYVPETLFAENEFEDIDSVLSVFQFRSNDSSMVLNQNNFMTDTLRNQIEQEIREFTRMYSYPSTEDVWWCSSPFTNDL